MAARKYGIEYFNTDTSNSQDYKILKHKFGWLGVGLLAELSKIIYKEYGFYMTLDKDTKEQFCHEQSVKSEDLGSVLEFLFDKGFFDRYAFENYNVLTSNEIIANFIHATKRRKGESLKQTIQHIKGAEFTEEVIKGKEFILKQHTIETVQKPSSRELPLSELGDGTEIEEVDHLAVIQNKTDAVVIVPSSGKSPDEVLIDEAKKKVLDHCEIYTATRVQMNEKAKVVLTDIQILNVVDNYCRWCLKNNSRYKVLNIEKNISGGLMQFFGNYQRFNKISKDEKDEQFRKQGANVTEQGFNDIIALAEKELIERRELAERNR